MIDITLIIFSATFLAVFLGTIFGMIAINDLRALRARRARKRFIKHLSKMMKEVALKEKDLK